MVRILQQVQDAATVQVGQRWALLKLVREHSLSISVRTKPKCNVRQIMHIWL